MVDWYDHYRAEYCVISYPKCGRTWLRVMLAKTLALHFEDPREVVFEPKDVIRNVNQSGPRIRFTHDRVARYTFEALERPEKGYCRYRRKRVIFLVRDPRDVLISLYFHLSHRRLFEGVPSDISQFIRHPLYGAEKAIRFMQGWWKHRHVPLDFHLVRYEDLHRDTATELRRVLLFMDLGDISGKTIQASVNYADFDSLRRMSVNELREVDKIAPTDPQNPESFKMRRGKVGTYSEYLSAVDVEYIEERMDRMLPTSLGYADQVREPCNNGLRVHHGFR
jgi:hypothetical protein